MNSISYLNDYNLFKRETDLAAQEHQETKIF